MELEVFGYESPHIAQTVRRQQINQVAENSARQANAWAAFVTTGWGEVAFPDCYEFDLTFAEQPFVAYSCWVQRNALADEDEILVPTRFPRCTGGVWGWKQNSRGFYTGAWCYVTVDTQSPFIVTVEADPTYTIQHHFTFDGLGIKDLPDYQVDEV